MTGETVIMADMVENRETFLVTGAAGFIGSHLCQRLLERGARVVGLDNFNDFYDPALKRRNVQAMLAQASFRLVEADIRERERIFQVFAQEKPGTVVHLAAMAGVRPSIQNPALYTAVNVDGTVNVLDAAVAHGVKRFIFASSSSIYGNNPKVPFSETDPVDQPISPYAATKKAGELICHTYHHLYRIPITCLRFFTVYGPRQRPDLAIARFLELIRQDKPIPLYGDGTASRDYTYIDDVLTGVLAAIERCRLNGPGGGWRIYNLGSNRPISLRELVSTIEKVTGRKAQIQYLPAQPGDVERTWADLTRARQELDYQPRVALEDGIARQWQALQAE